MSDVQTLLAKCRNLGASFTPTPEGKLKVRAPAPLPAPLRNELKARKAEVLRLLQAPAWPCPHCGRPAEIEEVCKSRDGERLLTLWHCEPCQTWGTTPDCITAPPAWVKRTEQ